MPGGIKQAAVYELSLDNFYWHELKTVGITPVPRFNCTCIVYHENMYIFGGTNEQGNKLNEYEKLLFFLNSIETFFFLQTFF